MKDFIKCSEELLFPYVRGNLEAIDAELVKALIGEIQEDQEGRF